MNEWYISKGNGQEGPLTAKQIGALLEQGELRATEHHAWKEGMPEWKSIAESGVLTEISMGHGGRANEAPSPSYPTPTAIKNPTPAP
ncbi:MAG: DUF4339 domain-containing protein, partial [Verrucomicrobiales bacterium]